MLSSINLFLKVRIAAQSTFINSLKESERISLYFQRAGSSKGNVHNFELVCLLLLLLWLTFIFNNNLNKQFTNTPNDE